MKLFRVIPQLLSIIFWTIIYYYAAVKAIEPVSTSVAIVAAVASIYVAFNARNYGEQCDDNWIKLNETKLSDSLRAKVYGQHLVISSVVTSLKAHVRKRHPSKALVLSFHGGTGSGKNFVSRIIAENIFKKGMKSRYVHLFLATHHFPHERKLETYKDQLRDWIKGNVTECPRSLFIFDEMDKLHPGLIDVIKPYIDHYEEINGVDYRNAIFIFLSNTGATGINEITLDYKKMGKKREDINSKDTEKVLKLETFNEKSGLWHSSLIEKDLVSVFVPFLPLERSHIMNCIRDDLKQKRFLFTDDNIVKKIANELQYFPEGSELFSKTGCKRVSDKVNLIMEET